MNRRVLVIDDEEGIRDAFRMALEDIDYEVFTAEDGERGVAMAAEVTPALVFLDLRMPGISGVETLRRLLARQPGLPIHIVTGFIQEFMRELQQAAEEGLCFELTRKPIGREQIQAVVRGVIEGDGGHADTREAQATGSLSDPG